MYVPETDFASEGRRLIKMQMLLAQHKMVAERHLACQILINFYPLLRFDAILNGPHPNQPRSLG
jgi:hypothetical protein